MIDPHVHCRDGRQAYKGTVRHVLEIAEQQGVTAIFDMPNTDPPILSGSDAAERVRLYVPEDKRERYFLYMGLTPDESQVEEAVRSYNTNPRVIGMKMYAGQSVGSLAVTGTENQRKIYHTLSGLGYEGVVAVHCEKEEYLRPWLWDPSRPVTHSYARPKEAETESVRDQLRLAKEAGFGGTLHVVHVSSPEAVDLLDASRRELRVTCGVTPHHLMWTSEMLGRPDGLLYKMNPPLRDPEDVARLRQQLRDGKIDWIETDHAPHTIGEKMYPPYFSGYPSLYLYRGLIENFLPALGLRGESIRKLTCENIRKTFENKLG
jgi:dihydroorotase